jgi:hypothetical protein
MAARTLADEMTVTDIVPARVRAGEACLHPNRVSIWPVELGGYGIDFTYHGATGYLDAENAEHLLQAGGLRTTFRQELDGAWTVRFGPLPRDHMRAVLDRFAW